MAIDPPARPLRLHRFARSGHCHRVELLLTLLGLPFECSEVNLAAREQKSPRFLALNAFGQVPVIEDGGFTLGDSNAILTYLAGRYGGPRWALDTPALAAEQQRWFSVAAGPLDAGPAAARAHLLFGNPRPLEPARALAHALFRVMDAHLQRRAFLLGEKLGLADIANYAYSAHAPEGGIPLDDYPHLRAWLARVEATPGFVGMPRSAPPGA
jgi:glutathione S-transferase